MKKYSGNKTWSERCETEKFSQNFIVKNNHKIVFLEF